MVEAGQLPRAEVAGEDEDAVAAIARLEVVVEALVADEAAGEGRSVGGHLAELSQQPAEVAVFEAQDVGALGGGHRGEGQLQIVQASAAQAAERVVGDAADQNAGCTGPTARERSEDVDEEPGEREFEAMAQRGRGCLGGRL